MTRRAGINVPLFSLRSTRSWGIGEIGDIPVFAEWLRAAHQQVLQILPLNELAPAESSPYSALSAMALDPQFISIWMLEDGPGYEQAWRDELAAVRASRAVDYATVRRLKARALRASFEQFLRTEWFRETEKAASLKRFATGQSWWLDDYSLFRALRARAGERPWLEWPAPLRDRDPAALARAREELVAELLYYQYVQWLADEQWRSAKASSRIQVLGDFPFMVSLDSADVWSRRGEFMLDASVGTPPDAFSETGQQWGLPPYDWEHARANDFEWFRHRVRRQGALYDGFRVDHLVGFYRTYVRPLNGDPPYFMPPHEDEQRALGESLMRIVMDTGADVSVEDLGTVPDFVRASIAQLGLPGYKVLRWEPVDPEMYPPRSVAMPGTHDTEPLALWWETLSREERLRFGFRAPVMDAVIRDAMLERMYRAGSDLVILPVQDVFGWRDRINQPATIGPENWTYTLPWPVDRLTHPEADSRADFLSHLAERTGRKSPPETQE